MCNDDTQWFYDPSTGEVSQGKEKGWDNRMGPYSSEAEARQALSIAAERNKAADADSDDNWGQPPSWEN
ncbi:hypothetical protein GP475_08145 [Corynebacterium poyangense]|uniref:Uncharacterized protein n=1 Tax=Corynebacterium poyangense TaxID=2684405 RepID=A0A7H0SPY9_9CORY|nr:hypothetical protein [Corynebacterium poyangense]MBZ8178460.1 hypothetical protein [Corynebacterium poyangense]QNQ90614.1 hypothetical protein GP475_08145 [Corynebacterium poyangense]